MTAPENPFFARALVNRYWKHFFGRGLVDPEDDLRETNPATNPELLDALAAHFVQERIRLARPREDDLQVEHLSVERRAESIQCGRPAEFFAVLSAATARGSAAGRDRQPVWPAHEIRRDAAGNACRPIARQRIRFILSHGVWSATSGERLRMRAHGRRESGAKSASDQFRLRSSSSCRPTPAAPRDWQPIPSVTTMKKFANSISLRLHGSRSKMNGSA